MCLCQWNCPSKSPCLLQTAVLCVSDVQGRKFLALVQSKVPAYKDCMSGKGKHNVSSVLVQIFCPAVYAKEESLFPLYVGLCSQATLACRRS